MKFSKMAMVGVAVFAGAAQADLYQWDWSADVDGVAGLNMNAGEFQSIHAEFDTNTDRFVWSVTFANQITDGYTLAVNNGPNPKGHAGELALIYFDASGADVRVTGYAYNGFNTTTSYQDGSQESGQQAADMIFASSSTENASLVTAASVIDNIDGTRVMTLEMDASLINSHNPAYPGPEGPSEWTGIGFEDYLGLWMHPFKNLNTSYDSNGLLTGWSGQQGWFDGKDYPTVPAPGAFALMGLGGMIAGRRRRA
ncbi:MAG: PEP-CTERM sorting domain-containing protein [Phycisphaerales bacterium]|jgi:hypothetical protein|tara:strand:- start:266026 stop:266787 length:762 start_codon:yes stop_codon:yes gene_type:complete